MPGSLLSTLTHHSDYVTSLACSPNSNFVATAGLRGELFLVDMEVGGVEGLRGELYLVDMEVGGVDGIRMEVHLRASPIGPSYI